MDPAVGGTFISLSENEQRCYAGLHALCQADSSGKLSASKVAELFRASQLPNDTLHQVTEVCGAKRVGFFASGQFYVALKLLAAAQAGLPVCLESISAELPLPMFVGIKSEGEGRYPNNSHSSENQTPPLSSATGSSPRSTANRPTLRHPNTSTDTQEPWSQNQSPHPSPPHSPPAYQSYPYAMPRNGPDSLLGYEGQHLQPGAGIGQEENSPSHYTLKTATEPPVLQQSVSVEKLVEADVEYSADPWRITGEQRDYYTHQFCSLQPDLSGLILGTVAKNFFTKSKLPIPELSHIWELSDQDRDGALSFPEFCTAFHLVVARKNGYPLPERLPPTLGAACREQSLPPPPQNTQPLIVFEDSATSRQAEMGVVSLQEAREVMSKQESSPKRPTVTAQDQLLLQTSTLQPDRQELDVNVKSRTRPRSYSSTSIDEALKKGEEPPTPPPRPQKTHSRASSLDLNKLLQQYHAAQGGKNLHPPPALPPRPSASQQITHFLPDKSSQQAVQQQYFTDFIKLREEEETGVVLVGGGSLTTEDQGAPKSKPMRRKLRPECPNVTPSLGGASSSPAPTKSTQRLPGRQKREIQTAIRKNRENNAVLTRLNSELQQQLQEVHHQRVTLESELDLLRPVAST